MISPDAKCMIYIKVLSLLSAYSQEQYLYRVAGGKLNQAVGSGFASYPCFSLTVDSNETMYSSDSKFLAEISTVSATVLDEILSYLASAKSANVSFMFVIHITFSTLPSVHTTFIAILGLVISIFLSLRSENTESLSSALATAQDKACTGVAMLCFSVLTFIIT